MKLLKLSTYPLILLIIGYALLLFNRAPSTVSVQRQNNSLDATQTGPVVSASMDVFKAVSQFYTYDTSAPLNAESISKEDFPTYTHEKIVFTGINHSRVPGILALPKQGSRPFPIVILIDAVGGSKDRWFTEDSWPRGTSVSTPLLDAGIAVLALDACYHGERAAENDYRNPQFSARPTDRDMIVQSIKEHRRAIDYLTTRSEVDTNRIGLLGISMGGIMTFALTSLDSRVKVAVAGVTPIRPMKETIGIPIAPMTFAPAIANTPFLLLMGRTDPFYSDQDAQQLLGLIKSPRKELVFFESGHRLPMEYTTKAVSWLKSYLK